MKKQGTVKYGGMLCVIFCLLFALAAGVRVKADGFGETSLNAGILEERSWETDPAEELPAESERLLGAASASVKNGPIRENGDLYYYVNGTKVRSKWKYIGTQKCYFRSNGKACTENVKIGGKIYVFRMNGRLYQPSKSSFVTINGNKYYVNTKGQASVGCVKIGSKRYLFRSNGRLVLPKKASVVKEGGYKYYVKTNGQAATGNVRVNGIVYIFRTDGRLYRPSKTSLYTDGSKYYLVKTSGAACIGWNVVNNHLYYANNSGVLWTNRTYEGIVFNKKGMATNYAAQLKMKAMSVMSSITKSSMTKAQKLKACWNYMVNRSTFTYWPKYPDLNKKGWQKETALDMLKTRRGNCYSFACAFAALAAEAGYSPKVICGRISGTRDQAADGLTRHAWVQIDGLYYDPEGEYAGWYLHVYGSRTYNVEHTIQKIVDFKKDA